MQLLCTAIGALRRWDTIDLPWPAARITAPQIARSWRLRRGLGLGVLMAGLWLNGADGYAQSLGEIAAREAARRATITTPSPVYTNRPRDVREPAAMPTTPDPVLVEVPPTRQATIVAGRVHTARETARVAPVPPDTSALRASVVTSTLSSAGLVNRTESGSATLANSVLEPTPPPDMKEAATSSRTTGASPSLVGWSAFQIKKTPDELAETARLADLPQVTARVGQGDVKLPPQRDAMRMSTGLGYLQGADWGGDVSGSGKINGMQTDISAFFTAGPMGFQPRSGRVSLFSPGGKWRGEGGSLYSDVRGLARGARLSWNAGQKWTPSVSLYLHRAAAGLEGATTIAYRDRFQVLPRVRLGGELATDGSRFLQVQYAQPKLDVTGFYRFVAGPVGGRDHGVSGSVDLARGVALSGALRVSDAVNDSSRSQLASIRLPLARQASITLERSWWNASANDGSINAVTVQLPLGPLRLIQRLQWGRTDYPQRSVPFGFDQRQIQSSASYTPGPWGSVNYQQSTQWFDDGRMQQWDEIASTLQLGRRTSAQFVTAFPDISDPRRFRARVTQQLSPTLSLEAEYGRLSAFQRARAFEGERSRVMVTVRKSWQLESPSRGGDVRGRIIDQAGYPVSGALVRLGPYSTITDEAGVYAFTRVPDGRFELALDKDKLPAAYASDEKPRPLTVTRGSRNNVDLQVVPLNAIRGRVYLDRNGNGYFDENEGIANAVVAVNGFVTATSATGSYAFYNQPPGRYKVRLDVPRLAKGLAPASPAELDVELTPDHPLFGVDFIVEMKDMPIIMRDIRP
jgi:hypothetical protein